MTEELVEVEGAYGRFYASPTKDPVVLKHIREHGAQQRGDLELLMALVKPGATIFDFGAHIGSMSIPLAHHVGPQGRVFAFEGSPDTFAVLEKNIQLNGLETRMTARNVVLAESETLLFSLVRSDENRGRTKFHEATDDGLPAVSLDQLCGKDGLPPPDLIKIDVEGMEPAVIRGGMVTIARHRPIIFFETNADDTELEATISALKATGYRLFANTGERNTATARWLLQEFNPLLMSLGQHQDLIAVPRSFDFSGVPHETKWSRRTVRQIVRRMAQRFRGSVGI